MKKLLLVPILGLMAGTVSVNRAEAQVYVSVNINIQPAWGPSGYDYAEFYYIPEINVYYDVVHRLFYYHQRGRWSSAPFLPAMYSRYDFYSLYKVVLNGDRYPWKYNSRHRKAYRNYCYNYAQIPIYYMKEIRYHHARNNFHGWVEPRYMPGNNGRPYSYDYSGNTRNGRTGSSSGHAGKPADPKGKEAVNGRSASTRSSAAAGGSSRSRDAVKQNSRNQKNTRDGDGNASVDNRDRENSRSSSAKDAARSSKDKSSRPESSGKTGRPGSSR
jgi:hypothetical protein